MLKKIWLRVLFVFVLFFLFTFRYGGLRRIRRREESREEKMMLEKKGQTQVDNIKTKAQRKCLYYEKLPKNSKRGSWKL